MLFAEVVVDIPQSVWATYQQLWLVANPGLIPCFPDPGLSEPCNPGLNISQRSILFTVIVLGIGMSALWQALVVDSYGKLLKVYFRDPSRATFPL